MGGRVNGYGDQRIVGSSSLPSAKGLRASVDFRGDGLRSARCMKLFTDYYIFDFKSSVINLARTSTVILVPKKQRRVLLGVSFRRHS